MPRGQTEQHVIITLRMPKSITARIEACLDDAEALIGLPTKRAGLIRLLLKRGLDSLSERAATTTTAK